MLSAAGEMGGVVGYSEPSDCHCSLRRVLRLKSELTLLLSQDLLQLQCLKRLLPVLRSQ